MLKHKVISVSGQIFDDLVSIRRYLHSHPEISYQEFNTSNFIKSELDKLSISYQEVAKTGIVANLYGMPSDRVLALRADIDALPINELSELSYKSINEGVMHACGHDVHTTILLGTARILLRLKDQWHGIIKLIFQPGEEKNPGGASIMISEGVLENPKPQGIVALHVNPLLDTGKVSFRSGKVMASADELYFTIKGNGGHAASPHLATDVIFAASQLVVALQQVVSRNSNPLSPSVLSICSIHGGSTTNVIPNEVQLKGTFRTLDESWRMEAHGLIKSIATGISVATGATIETNIDVGYPSVYNEKFLTLQCKRSAIELLGENFVEKTELRMGAEDFGYYTQKIPGCFFRLGTRNEALGITHNVHTPYFNIDERAIETGVSALSYIAMTINLQ